jgi:hypothetical protein
LHFRDQGRLFIDYGKRPLKRYPHGSRGIHCAHTIPLPGSNFKSALAFLLTYTDTKERGFVPETLMSLRLKPTSHASSGIGGRGFTGCGKTFHGCHPERREGSRSAYLLENASGQILRFALQNDSFEEFFRSL